MATLGGFLQTALGQDPNAFQRGAEAELKLQALQRAEQARLNQQQYAPPQQDLTVSLRSPENLDPNNFGSGSQLYIEPPKKKEEKKGPELNTIPPPEIINEESDLEKTDEKVTLEPSGSALTIPNFDSEAEPDMSKIGVSKTPDITQIDQESSQFIQSLQGAFARSDFASILNSIQVRIATGYGDMLAGSPAGRAWGWLTDSPSKAAKRAESKAALDWFQSDEAKRYFEQNPKELTGAAADPIGFHKTFIAEAPLRADDTINKKSKERTDKLVTNINSGLNEGVQTMASKVVAQYAQMFGFDPYFAMAVLGVESSFGKADVTPKTVKLKDGTEVTISGVMQVAEPTFNQMKAWYTNPTNIKKYGISIEVQNLVRTLDYNNPEHQAIAGIMYLKYGEYINVPKNLLAAGYQGGMETVAKKKSPTGANDGNITNADYNRAVIEVYNNMLVKFGQPTVNAGVVNQQNKNAGLSVTDVNQTEAQSSNTTNTAKADENVSSLQIIEGKTITANDNNIKEEGEVAKENEVNSPAIYIENPSKIGLDMQRAMKTREESVLLFNRLQTQMKDYQRMAEIYRISGDMENYMKFKGLAEQAYGNVVTARDTVTAQDQNIVYLQGMQGLNDLRYGNNPNRLNMVWSMYSGREVRIVPRSDGNFNIMMDGQMISENISMRDVSNLAQIQFDSSYRADRSKDAADKSMKLFEANIDMQKEQQKMVAEIYKLKIEQNLKAKAEQQLELIKQLKGEFKAVGDGSGKGIIQIGGQVYLFDPMMEFTKPDSDEKYFAPGTKKITFQDAATMIQGSGSEANPYLTDSVNKALNNGAG